MLNNKNMCNHYKSNVAQLYPNPVNFPIMTIRQFIDQYGKMRRPKLRKKVYEMSGGVTAHPPTALSIQMSFFLEELVFKDKMWQVGQF